MKVRGLGGAGADFHTTLCALYSIINALQYTIVNEKKHFQGGGGLEGLNRSLRLAEVATAWINLSTVLNHGSANLPYSITNLEKLADQDFTQ